MLYFDCETLSTGDDGLPVDIVLAVTLVNGKETVWRERPIAKPFTAEPATNLAQYLVNYPGQICTFNGASFDFKIVAALVPSKTLRKQLVAKCLHHHVDIMMDWFSSQGYYSSMSAFCEGCKVGGKSWSGAESAKAAVEVFNSESTNSEKECVMKKIELYCIDDCRCLEQLLKYLETNCCLKRIAKTSGKISSWTPWNITSIRTVAQCIHHWQIKSVVPKWLESHPPSPLKMVSWIKAAVEH